MTHRHDDADPIEHDPTGMRALLGSLPDPGPMPDDLVARITRDSARRLALVIGQPVYAIVKSVAIDGHALSAAPLELD